jgi:hypothetical protein
VEIPRALPDDPEKAAHIYRLANLHKHWLHADSIKQRIRSPVLGSKKSELPAELLAFGQFHSAVMALLVWYALLYVVIEGYREMGLDDPDINRLLAHADDVDRLRRLRNGIFHYQREPFSEKLMAFLLAGNSENWIRDLNRAFSAFFLRELPIKEWVDNVQKPKFSTWAKFLKVIRRSLGMSTA